MHHMVFLVFLVNAALIVNKCYRRIYYLTLLKEDMCDDRSAQRARSVSGAVLSQCPQTGFTEDVVAGIAHVRTEVHIQAHCADVTFSVPGAHDLFILTAAAAAAAGWVHC